MILRYIGRFSPIPLMELGIKVKTGEVFECENDKLAADYLKKDVFLEASEEELEKFEAYVADQEKQENDDTVVIAAFKFKIAELEAALKAEKKEHTNTKTRATKAENKAEKLEKELEEATKPEPGLNGNSNEHGDRAPH